VDVEINDWAFHQAVYLPFMMQAKFSQETTEGYSKGITVGEDPGREEYKTASRQGSRSVLVRKRFHTKIDVHDMGPEALQEWWGRVKVAALPAGG
jgi:hypothetical protein